MQVLQSSKFRTSPERRIPQKKDKKWVFLWVLALFKNVFLLCSLFALLQLTSNLIEKQKSLSVLINEGFEESLVRDIYKKIKLNEYKRKQAPPALRVSSKAFGMGRRLPIVNNFNG